MVVVISAAKRWLTVVIPVAGYHDHLVARAVESVQAQTMPTDYLVVHDLLGQGAGWARNAGAAMCRTPFIAFLDADDWLYPEFTARMLAAAQRGKYVYCDWQREGVVNRMPDALPIEQSYALHINTTVMHTEAFKWLGGYDEQTVFEDTEFYFRAMSRGFCGVRCASSLVEYTDDGQRNLRATALQHELIAIYRKYHAMASNCNCGGSNPSVPVGQRLEGDVLVRCEWGGKRAHKGYASGRHYDPAGNGKQAWVAKDDALSGIAILGPGGQQGKYTPVLNEPLEPQKDFDDLKQALLNHVTA